jgi:protease II
METETDTKINFLDITIQKERDNHSVYSENKLRPILSSQETPATVLNINMQPLDIYLTE